jgi:sulfofructose kinase
MSASHIESPAKSPGGRPIVAVGHAALDYVYKIAAFPPAPTKLRASRHIASGGGMAANAAAAVARLGGTVALWSRIGNDAAGRIIREQLQEAGVDAAHVRAFASAHSPTAAVIVDDKGERLVVSEDDHGLPLAADWLPLADIAGAGAVMSDLTWLEGSVAAFGAAREHGVPTVLDIDLGSGVLLPKVIGLTDYAIFSSGALRRFVEGADDRQRLQSLIALGVSHAGVTLGAKGYLWINRDGDTGDQAAFPVAAVDTTGAGDAFHGAFAWALSQSKSDAECARFASAVAALSCLGLGARSGLPTRAEMEAFLHRHG